MFSTTIPNYKILDIIRLERRNFSMATENKSCVVLSCRLSGESLFFYNGGKYFVRPGDVLYIPAGANYTQECEAEELICIHLAVSGCVDAHFGIFTVEDPSAMCDMFCRAWELWKKQNQSDAYLCMSLLFQIMAVSGAGLAWQQTSIHPLLEPAVVYLQEHIYEEALSLESVYRCSHISRTYFNRLFRKTYGSTPVEYINRQRIQRARQFVVNGTYTNTEIAHLCGFRDVKYFYVVFKRLTGMTTMQYKRSAMIHTEDVLN